MDIKPKRGVVIGVKLIQGEKLTREELDFLVKYHKQVERTHTDAELIEMADRRYILTRGEKARQTWLLRNLHGEGYEYPPQNYKKHGSILDSC